MLARTRVIALAAIAMLSIGAIGWASQGDETKSKRIAYVVKYGAGKDMAAILSKHFKGDVEIQLAGEGGSVLLLAASPKVYDEVLATLAKLDRRPQVVAIDIYILEAPAAKAAGKAGAEQAIDEKELSGPADKVAAAVFNLQRKGAIGAVRRLTLTAVENLTTTIVNGETKPYIAGVTTTAKGVSQYATQYRNVGTSIQLTPRVGADKVAALDIKLDESRMFQPEDGVPLGVDDKGRPIMATEFISAKLTATVSVASGQALLVEGVQTTSKTGTTRTMVIVGAKWVP